MPDKIMTDCTFRFKSKTYTKMRSRRFNIKNIPCHICLIIIGFSFLLSFSALNNMSVVAEYTSNSIEPLTATAYVNILRLRRNDHRSFVQNMLDSDYARNFKMISLAVEKIFHVFKDSNKTLTESGYLPSRGFPNELEKQEAVILILENCCLVADVILHFPEISHKVLKKVVNWKSTVNWCIGFVNLFPQITNESISELMDLVRQEINEEERTQDFINPYYTKVDNADTQKKKKSKKKIKKGPALTKQEL